MVRTIIAGMLFAAILVPAHAFPGLPGSQVAGLAKASQEPANAVPVRYRHYRRQQASNWSWGGGWSNWGRPMRYIGGRLVCAVNVNAALAERGIRGTGSALAHSFDRWGRASAPVPGAVAVTDRRGGGHVAIVSRVEGGRVFVWNPSSRGRGWREVEYTGRHARYRVPA